MSLYYPPSFGLAGAFVNRGFVSWFGWPAHVFPFFLIWAGFRGVTVRREISGHASYLFFILAGPGVGFILALSSWGLLVFKQPDIAGQAGRWMAQTLMLQMGLMGAVAITLAAAMLWSHWVFSIPWGALLRQASRALWKDFESWRESVKEARRQAILEKVQKSTELKPKALLSRPPKPAVEAAGSDSGLKEEAPDKSNGASSGHSSVRVQTKKKAEPSRWNLPSLELLLPADPAKSGAVSDDLLRARGESLVRALSTFGLQVILDGVEKGPVVSRYDVVPQMGVKVSQVEARADDIALAMKVGSVRIVGLIAGKGAIGIEVPNPTRQMVRLREILEHPGFAQPEAPLTFALGRLANGEPISCNLAAMPHFLVAGATGSGKSVLVHALVASFLCRLTPDELKLMLMDPKRLELPSYDGIPHLFDPRKMAGDVRVITDSKEAAKSLAALVDLMEVRYEKFGEKAVRNIAAYNEKAIQENFSPEPYIVVIIDELADMMLVAGKEVETSIQRLAQMARAVGIHLVLATQRPSTDVITGVIKANLPARVALQVVSNTDSRVILDTPGAEDLLGAGDMLFLDSGAPKPARLQGSFVTDEEIARLVNFWKEQGAPSYEDPADMLGLRALPGLDGKISKDEEESIRSALRLVLERKRVSQDLLKDHFRTSSKASNVLSQLEVAGFIFKPEGTNRWEIRYDRIEQYLSGTKDQKSGEEMER